MRWLVLGAVLPPLLISWGAAFLVRRKAPAWRWIDRPGERKVHDRPMPTGGGLAIWSAMILSFAAGQIVLWLIAGGYLPVESLPEFARPHVGGLQYQAPKLWTVLAAGTVLMVLGLVDDRRGLDWRLRLAVQAAVALVMVGQGWRLTAFIDVPLLTATLSVLWIVAVINAFNMLDNMDGLSAGVAAIVAAMLAGVMLLTPDPLSRAPQLFVAGYLLVLIGALLGFLWHNHTPARLFMGDGGSYLIGFSIAVATLMATYAGGDLPPHAILAPLCVLAVPLYDMVSVLLIRLRHGRSPFTGDTSHFSHRLVELGLSKMHAVWTIYLATATCGLGALLLHQVDLLGALLILTTVGCVLAIIAILETAGRSKR